MSRGTREGGNTLSNQHPQFRSIFPTAKINALRCFITASTNHHDRTLRRGRHVGGSAPLRFFLNNVASEHQNECNHREHHETIEIRDQNAGDFKAVTASPLNRLLLCCAYIHCSVKVAQQFWWRPHQRHCHFCQACAQWKLGNFRQNHGLKAPLLHTLFTKKNTRILDVTILFGAKRDVSSQTTNKLHSVLKVRARLPGHRR